MSRRLLLTLFFGFLSTASSGAEDTLVVLPESFQLMYPEAEQQVILEKRDAAGRFVGQVHDGISWKSTDPNVAVIVENRVRAVGDGEATIEANWQGQKAKTTVKVSGTTEDFHWEFRRHVLPILAKQGCNSGACHGALAGKGGFKLSLRGYDPLSDHWWITRQARGRRLEPADPARSLLLAKPSGSVPHKGGV